MTTPTIKRRKWHQPEANWQATDADGRVYGYERKPRRGTPAEVSWFGIGMWFPTKYSVGVFIAKRRPPADWTSTLRRIEPVRRKL